MFKRMRRDDKWKLKKKREKVRNIIREKFEWKNNIYIFFSEVEKKMRITKVKKKVRNIMSDQKYGER